MKRFFLIQQNMKRVIFLFAVLLSIESLSAQEQVFFVPCPETARWSYQEHDADGKAVATISCSVDEQFGNAVNGTARIKVQKVSPASPKEIQDSFIYYRFKDGECMLDMNAFFEGDALARIMDTAYASEDIDASEEEKQQAIAKMKELITTSGEMRGIPQHPVTGKLPDFEFQFKIAIVNMTISGSKRAITGTERIDTPAGTYDCFILEETITTKAMMTKEVEKTISWYAYGIGMVKQETYDKKGKLTTTTILNSINW